MAKNAALFYDAAIATANQPKSSAERGENSQSIFQLAKSRIASFLSTQKDRQVEDFINARGGVINDALERELNRHFGRM